MVERVTVNGKPYTLERVHGGQAFVVPVVDPRSAAQGTAGRWVSLAEVDGDAQAMLEAASRGATKGLAQALVVAALRRFFAWLREDGGA